MSTTAPDRVFPHRHLLSLDGYSREDVTQILDTAEAFFEVSRRAVRKVPTLRGKTVLHLFYEDSTRTRTSFELAAKRLSADTLNLSVKTSSVKKGESLNDTCKTLGAMHPDIVVIRHGASGAPHYVARKMDARVVNAGDGMHAHPTQALLDAFTIRRKKGTLEGLKVAILGDIAHSRVARSGCRLLRLFGCDVSVVGPRTLIPRHFAEAFDVKVHDRLEPALEGADVVMALRIQQERLAEALLPSLREYNRVFGLTSERMKLAQEDAIVMHPGPMNRGVEIDPDVADGPQSVILDQVEAGVATRMAVLYVLLGQGRETGQA